MRRPMLFSFHQAQSDRYTQSQRWKSCLGHERKQLTHNISTLKGVLVTYSHASNRCTRKIKWFSPNTVTSNLKKKKQTALLTFIKLKHHKLHIIKMQTLDKSLRICVWMCMHAHAHTYTHARTQISLLLAFFTSGIPVLQPITHTDASLLKSTVCLGLIPGAAQTCRFCQMHHVMYPSNCTTQRVNPNVNCEH